MFKPLTRSAKMPRPNAGFAETQFLHTAADEDYSGFAPTEMFDDDVTDLADAPVSDIGAATPSDEPSIPQSWVTSQWVAAQEAKAHEAANQARAVIAAQRRAEEQAGEQAEAAGPAAAAAAPRTGLARLRAAFERLLPGEFRGLLPLFIGVSVTMVLISSVLPLLDRP